MRYAHAGMLKVSPDGRASIGVGKHDVSSLAQRAAWAAAAHSHHWPPSLLLPPSPPPHESAPEPQLSLTVFSASTLSSTFCSNISTVGFDSYTSPSALLRFCIERERAFDRAFDIFFEGVLLSILCISFSVRLFL